MRRRFGSGRVALVLTAALLAAAGLATVGSARTDTVDTAAKLGPKPARGGQQALYRTSLTSTQGTATKVTSATTFPAGTTVDELGPGSPTCTASGVVVTCAFGNVAAGVTVGASIKVTLLDPAAQTTIDVPTVWQFKDPGGGQPGTSESYDSETVTDSTTLFPSGDASANGDCLAKTGGESLSANLGEASIAFTTPAFGTLLCVPVGLQVSPGPAVPVECFPGRQCKSEKLTSFAGATFSAGMPAEGTLVWPTGSVLDKKAAVVFNDGVHPPFLVPLCADVTLSETTPACEVTRKASGGLLKVNVRWLGNDPSWEV
jgi:hypothetical protein